MANLGTLRDLGPVAPMVFQHGLDCDVESLFHGDILVNFSCERKEPFTIQVGHSVLMAEKTLTINEVVAQNLAYWMAQANMKQAALAEKAGVSQKTISNYLNPSQRVEGSTGKQPSAKLSELDSIARALHIGVWQLTRQMSPRERQMYELIEKAYAALHESADTGGRPE